MAETAVAALNRVRSSSLLDVVGLLLVGTVVVWLAFKFAENPERFLNVTVIGLTVGATYALIALGYTLVYGILQLINFAHGDVFALSGLVAGTIVVSVFGLDADSGVLLIIAGLLLTLAITMPGFALINAAIERIAYKPLRNAPRLAPLITAVGVSFILQNVGLALYGPSFKSFPNFIPRTDAIEIGGVAIQWNDVAVFAVVIPLLAHPHLVRALDPPGEVDARRRPGHRRGGHARDRRQPDDLAHLHARGRAGGRRGPRLHAPVQHAVRHRLRAGPDRLHRGGPRRDREPAGRGPGRDA